MIQKLIVCDGTPCKDQESQVPASLWAVFMVATFILMLKNLKSSVQLLKAKT